MCLHVLDLSDVRLTRILRVDDFFVCLHVLDLSDARLTRLLRADEGH